MMTHDEFYEALWVIILPIWGILLGINLERRNLIISFFMFLVLIFDLYIVLVDEDKDKVTKTQLKRLADIETRALVLVAVIGNGKELNPSFLSAYRDLCDAVGVHFDER